MPLKKSKNRKNVSEKIREEQRQYERENEWGKGSHRKSKAQA